MRIDENLKANAEKAAALKGMKSLTEYVVRLIQEDAEQVIRAHGAVTVENNVFDRFMTACEAADAPNDQLLAAKRYSDQHGMQ